MKIFAFAGSNSRRSINKQLVEFAAGYFPGHDIELADLNDYEMPIYSADREREQGIPVQAHLFAEKIDGAELLLISLAEHNGAYSTAFKNIFDWISRIPERKTFGDKPMLLMATSPGPRGGATVLELAQKRMPFSGGKVLGNFSLPSFNAHFTPGEGITHAELRKQFEAVLASVKAEVEG